MPLETVTTPSKPGLGAVTIEDFLRREIPAREMILDPVLPTQGLAMVYAARGIGKTHVGLGIGYAAATGSSFLRWSAPKPRRVLYVDGEMPAVVMQERLAALVSSWEAEPPAADYFRLVTPDLLDDPMPNLGTIEGQQAVTDALEGAELLIVDNLSCLVRGGRENEADGWQGVQDWLLSLRRQGVSVLLLHHAGKGGAQRGTSRREDVLDTVVNLRRPADYQAEQGARFEVHLEKARGLYGDDAKPFEAALETRDGSAIWTIRELEDAELQRVVDLKKEGLSVRDIAEELAMKRSAVQRRIDRARNLQLID